MSSKLLVFGQFFSLFLLMLPFYSSKVPYAEAIFTVLSLLSGILALWTFKYNKLGNFNIVPDIKIGSQLITTGPYKLIRHPMYTSVTLIALALLTNFSIYKLIIFIFLMIILSMKASREEAYWSAHSEHYKAYKQTNKMFIPYIL